MTIAMYARLTWLFARRDVMNSIVYRLYLLGGWVAILTYMFSIGTFWRALYGNTDSFEGVDLRSMVSYAMVAMLVGPGDGIGKSIAGNVKTGDIGYDLLKPVDYQAYTYLQVLGGAMAGWIKDAAPPFMFSVFILGMALPASPVAAGWFVVSVFLGITLMFTIEFTIGCAGIFLLDTSGLSAAKKVLLSLLSGQLVPIWFFPFAFQHVLFWLPFQGLSGTPVSIYIGKFSGNVMYQALALQSFWVAIGWIGSRWAFLKVKRHLVVQGG